MFEAIVQTLENEFDSSFMFVKQLILVANTWSIAIILV